VPRGFYDAPPDEQRAASSTRGEAAAAAAPAAIETDAALLAALRSAHPAGDLPTTLSLGFVDLPETGAVVTASALWNAATLDFGGDGEAGQAVLDLLYAVFNDQGQGVSSSQQRLTLDPPSQPVTKEALSNRVAHGHQFRLEPGLYQVRVAARDRNTGRVGSAMEWIEVPNLAGGPLAMSSLILGERAPGAGQLESGAGQVESGAAAANPPMEIHADHRFGGAQPLRFLTYVYNAARSGAPPDVTLKVQVFRDSKAVIATPLFRLATEGIADLSRIPYFAELNLKGMASGGYVLQVTATDRAAGTQASQRMNFEIE
jgi:hypothetical protein